MVTSLFPLCAVRGTFDPTEEKANRFRPFLLSWSVQIWLFLELAQKYLLMAKLSLKILRAICQKRLRDSVPRLKIDFKTGKIDPCLQISCCACYNSMEKGVAATKQRGRRLARPEASGPSFEAKWTAAVA